MTVRDNVEAVYPLSPLQEGLLFHHLAGGREGEYCEQLSCTLAGPLDHAAFAAAWRRVQERHAALRTAFLWDGLERPLQVVQRDVPLPLEEADWLAVPAASQPGRQAELLLAERRRGFDLGSAPLMRLRLIRRAPDLHQLVWTYQHLVLDGWSVAIVLAELFQLYGVLVGGQDVALAGCRPFRDYIAWLQTRDLGEAESSWRQLFAGWSPAPPLAGDHDPASWAGGEDDHGLLRLEVPDSGRLAAVARSWHLTLNTLLQGAWALLLSYHTGHPEAVFGVTSAGRPAELAGAEAMVGLFVNTLPMRVRVDGAAPVRGWLRRLQELSAEQRRFEFSPLVKVQEWSGVEHGRPLFDTLLAFENYPVDPALARGNGDGALHVVGEPVVWQRTHYPLALQILPGETLRLRALFDRRRFEPATIRRLLGHLCELLAGLAGDPERRLDALSPLAAGERHQLLHEWAEAALTPPPAGCLHDRFAAWAARTPDAVAVSAGERRLSYAELDRRANQLAHRLHRLGVRPRLPVAVCCERGPELAIAILGVLKAGCPYVPLDPAYPAARLAWVLRDTRASVMVTVGPLAGERAGELAEDGSGPALLRLEADAAALARMPGDAPRSGASADDLAYVIYTSGSTGTPKGVMVSHAQVLRLFAATAGWFGFDRHDVWTLFHSAAFDFSVWELWGALLHGGRLAVVSFDDSRSPADLARQILDERVTVLNQTPSAFYQLAALPAAALPAGATALRWVIFGGEALDLAVLRPWFERHGDRQPRLANMYGITETTVHVTWKPLSRADLGTGPASPIGIAIPDLSVQLLDAHGGPLAIGITGELLVGGGGVARGYWGRPELTAERFVPDPCGRGARLYRSGDLARRRADGSLEYLGRSDQQIKIRGYRIEPGEIEARLAEHPAVRQCVVVAVPGADGDRQLVAYAASPQATADGAAKALGSELRSWLAGRLPDYLVPGAVVALAALPLTATGKVDRRALPAPDRSLAPTAGSRQPGSELETRLVEIWRAVLGVDRIGVDDNFFALGGHSVLATRLTSRVREELAADVGLRALFERPTVAGFAAAISLARATRAEQRPSAGDADDTGALPALVPRPEHWHEPFPLTDVQQAYWVGRRPDLDLGGVAAHFYLELDGADIDLDRLDRAWRRLIDRHPMLRAVILPDGRQQVLERVPPYRIAVADLRGVAAGEADASLAATRAEMSHQVLAADRWPLFELRASLCAGGRVRLHASLDTLIVDGWSFQLLGAELSRLYAEPAAALPEIRVSFRDYVLAEAALREGAAYRRSLDYWRERLPALPPAPELPLAVRPQDLRRPLFEHRSHRLAAASWRALREHGRGAGLSASAVLLAAFSEVLAAWCRQPRFTLNLTLFNRLPLHPQVDSILGDFTSLTLLEVDAGAAVSFAAMAQQLQERLWTDLDHRQVGGVWVQRELARRGGGRAGGMPVVFTSVLNLRQAEDPEDAGRSQAQPPPLPVTMVYSISQTPQVWLDHQVAEAGGELALTWDAPAGLFPPGLLDAMFGAYAARLEQLAGDRESWQAPLPCLLPAEQRALLAVRAAAPEAPATTLHELFLTRAAAAPSAAAVIAAGRTLSYGELEQRSRRLARLLQQLGARPGALVAVAMEKGWEQSVAVLGVLRAGAAYLPVEPALPAERRAWLLAHGRVEIVLTQARLREGLSLPAELQVVAVDELAPHGDAGAAPAALAGPADLAYVLFTSGSTGVPKGVMIEHRSAANTLVDLNRRFGVGAEDRVLALSSLSFDLSVYDLLGALAAGATVIVPEPWADRDPSRWHELMLRERISLWNSVPTLMEMLVEYLAGQGERIAPSLRLVLLSGDWIPVTLPDRVRRLAPDAAVVGMGGATEASIWSILHPIGDVDPGWRSIPYGRALENQTVQILDHRLELRPFWVPGEIYIGGSGLARGYWHDEEKTRAAFLVHPRTGERLYRTGDLGRYLPDGAIEFLGREDSQVKIQGHRIELGEIEAALAQHPAVQAAVAAVWESEPRQRRLVAYVVPAAAPAAATAGLLADLALKLGQPGLRREPERPAVALPGGAWAPEHLPEGAEERRSHRHFGRQPLPLERLGTLLGCLASAAAPGQPLPRYRYGSAGSLYTVQLYLWVPPGRVAGLASGTYYHDPSAHRLVSLADAALAADLHAPANRAMFEESAFSLFLVGKLDAGRSLYGERGRHYAVLEAGLMTQLLEMSAPAAGIGLCQIGDLDFDRVRPWLALDADHELLHALTGGPLDGQAPAAPPPDGTDGKLAAELERFLRGKLPEPMVPRFFVFLPRLPLTANGKVDRQVLPAPQLPAVAAGGGPQAPRSDLEQQVAAVVCEVLGRGQIGVEDNLFDLGGTSVHLVRVYGRLRELAGRELPLVEMFNHPTVRAMASYLLADPGAAATGAAGGDAAGTRRGHARERRRAGHPDGGQGGSGAGGGGEGTS